MTGRLNRRMGGQADRGIYNHPSAVAAAIVACATLSATPAATQYPSAHLVPKGVMRISFEPLYMNLHDRFDADGNIQPLGTDFTDSSAGTRLIPTMAGAQLAIRSITGDPSYAIDAGAFTATLEGDIRRLSFDFHFGLADWLTITARLPLVTTRAQVDFAVDSTGANVGWNQAATQAGNVSARATIQSLLMELETGIQYVSAQVASGGYDCPAGPTCAEAQDVVARAQQIKVELITLSGLDESGAVSSVLPPFSPLASSTAAQAILSAVADLSSDLQALGATAISAAYPFPSSRVGAQGISDMLGDSALGYAADPLAFTKYRNQLGDVEVGLRMGLLQRATLRTVVSATVRLPTGKLDSPDNYVDIGSGDRQPDLEIGVEGYWQASTFLSLAANASYNLQMGSDLVRRVAPHDEPLAPLSTRATVSRSLGNEIRAGLFPSLRLSDAFTVYGSAHYYRKGTDGFTLSASDAGSGLDASLLEFETARTTWSVGGGIYYRADRDRDGPTLPVEAGIDYRAALQGSGGQTPKTSAVNFYLRLYWRWFGR